MSAEVAPSWEEHYAAAAAMGLDPREAFETFEAGWLQARRASREYRERLERAVADLQSPSDDREDQR